MHQPHRNSKISAGTSLPQSQPNNWMRQDLAGAQDTQLLSVSCGPEGSEARPWVVHGQTGFRAIISFLLLLRFFYFNFFLF